jgi:hypothetical protein
MAEASGTLPPDGDKAKTPAPKKPGARRSRSPGLDALRLNAMCVALFIAGFLLARLYFNRALGASIFYACVAGEWTPNPPSCLAACDQRTPSPIGPLSLKLGQRGHQGQVQSREYQYAQGVWADDDLWAGYIPRYLDTSFLGLGRKWPAFQHLRLWRVGQRAP